MELTQAIVRAARAMREEARLHAIAISSLTIAFLCLGASLLVMTNLDRLAATWSEETRLTVFLREGARAEDVSELTLALEALPEVSDVVHVTSAEAREQFLADSALEASLRGVPVDAFPASLEVSLAAGGVEHAAAVADRLSQFPAVEDVETYRGWFERLESLLVAGRGLAAGIALLVLLCVAFVVGNTIRLAVAGRRDEIEVMKLCGASDQFVRRPFLVEGVVQGAGAALLAIVTLLVGYLLVRQQLDGAVLSLVGFRTVFLHPLLAFAVLAGGALMGACGSALSLRRYLSV